MADGQRSVYARLPIMGMQVKLRVLRCELVPLLLWAAVSALPTANLGCGRRSPPPTSSATGKLGTTEPSTNARLTGSPDGAPLDQGAACPADMVDVTTFCIDTYEAHLVRLGEDAAVTPHPYYERPEEGGTYMAVSEAGAWPQAYVNRFEAQSACERAGKRLCTVSEWYRACIGPQQWTYSYGVQEQRGVCNTKKPHLLARFFGTDPHRWKYREHFNDPRLNQEPGFLAKTGEYTGCVSQEGVHDLVGNLHEWVSDAVDPSLADKLPLLENIHNRLGINRGHGIFMGGFYSTGSQHGYGCGFVTIGHGPTYHDYSTGFRCCRDLGH